MLRNCVVFAAVIVAASGAADARGGSIIASGGPWAAVLRGNQCEAQSRVTVATAKGRVAALAGFTFAADRSRWGQFSARLSREPRRGASVIAAIGGQQFLLVSRGAWAWSRDNRQDMALLAAVRNGDWLRIHARDGAGRRFTDAFPLAFAPTAIDAAAARCAALGVR